MAYGNAKAESKALQRLVKTGEIERVAADIYVRPIIDTVFGKVFTSVESIAKALQGETGQGLFLQPYMP